MINTHNKNFYFLTVESIRFLMLKTIVKSFLLTALLAMSFLFSFSLFASPAYEVLGNPYQSKYKKGEMIYARNIWDMQLFDQRIYLGAGNSSNRGPAQNAGRVPLIYLDLKTEKFVYEYKVAEEQVDLFKVYDKTLYIPGHDATQKWTFGNIYSKQADSKWKKHRTLENALHVYDLIVQKERFFTAVGLNKKGAVLISDNHAKSWKEYPQGSGRVYSLFQIGHEMFASRTFKRKKPDKISVSQWKAGKGFIKRKDIGLYSMFPDTKFSCGSVKVTRALSVGDSVYYLGSYKHNDHQSKPFAVYKASLVRDKIKAVKLDLEKGFIPRDIIYREGLIYVLANKQAKKNQIKVFMFEHKNLNRDLYKKKETISFNYPAFARSFEEYKGCFYFGMGSDLASSKHWKLKELKIETGDILKVCNQ